MKPRRGLILFLGLALALIVMIMLGRAAYRIGGDRLSWLNFAPTARAYTEYQTYGQPPEQLFKQPAGCNGSLAYDSGTLKYCVTEDHYPPTNSASVTGVRFWNLACDSADAASYQVGAYVGIYDGTFHDVQTSPTTYVLTCGAINQFDDISATPIPFDFALNTPITTDTGKRINTTLYLYEINGNPPTATNVSQFLWYAIHEGDGALSFALLSGTAGPAGPSVSMYFPSDATASSSIPEFRNWIVDGDGLDPLGNIQVQYSLVSSSVGSDLYDNKPTPLLLGDRNIIPKTHQLWFPPLVAPTTWYARAVYSATTTPTAYSDMIQFSVDPNGSITPFASSTEINFYHAYLSTSTEAGVAQCSNATGGFLDDPIGNIVDAMCAAFNPDPVALQAYSQLGADLSTRPPFGYFGAVGAGLSGIAATSSALVFMTPSTTDAFADVFTPIRTGLSVVILLLAGFWIWNRLRHLEI